MSSGIILNIRRCLTPEAPQRNTNPLPVTTGQECPRSHLGAMATSDGSGRQDVACCSRSHLTTYLNASVPETTLTNLLCMLGPFAWEIAGNDASFPSRPTCQNKPWSSTSTPTRYACPTKDSGSLQVVWLVSREMRWFMRCCGQVSQHDNDGEPESFPRPGDSSDLG